MTSVNADDPVEKAGAARVALRQHHAALPERGPDAEVDDGAFDELVRLTAEVVDLQDAVGAARLRAAGRTTTVVVLAAAAVLGLAAAALLIGAWGIGGWVSGWGAAGAGLVIGLAALLVRVTTTRPAARHRASRADAAIGVVGGAALLVVAAGWTPWYGAVALIIVFGIAVLALVLRWSGNRT